VVRCDGKFFQAKEFGGVSPGNFSRGVAWWLANNPAVRFCDLVIGVFVAQFYVCPDEKAVLEFLKERFPIRRYYSVVIQQTYLLPRCVTRGSAE